MTNHDEIELQLAQLRTEFRVFRDNHFYHFQRDTHKRFDALEELVKDRKLWLAVAATFVIVVVDLLK